MAVLNAWQRIDRVLPGQPFGNGVDGALSSATIPTVTKDFCTGTSGSTSLTTNGSTFANGDIILIHQSRGTGATNWEINRVASGGGSASLTLQVALQNSYATSGGSVAQAVKIPCYTTVTVQSGTWTVPAWDGSTGGIFPIAANISITNTGSINAAGKGYRGGIHQADGNGASAGGESNSGYPGSAATGAGQCGATASNGSGGGYGTAGGAGGGTVGAVHGSADLTVFDMGGAGAGSTANPSGNAGDGGASGGVIILITKSLVLNSTVVANGGAGQFGNDRGGAGGSGGAVLAIVKDATLGTNQITVAAGAGGQNNNPPAGGVGRISIHHQGTVTGTTTPTFNDTSEPTLIESLGGSFLLNMI